MNLRKAVSVLSFAAALAAADVLVAQQTRSQAGQNQSGQNQSGQSGQDQSGQSGQKSGQSGQNQSEQSGQRQSQSGASQSQSGGQQNQSGQRAGWQSTEQKIATSVIIDNQEEVALGKFAQSKAQNEEVKKFAEMLVTDHQEFIEKLQRFAPDAARQSLEGNQQRTGDRNSQQNTQNSSQQNSSQQNAQNQASGVQQAGGANQAQSGRNIQQTAGTPQAGGQSGEQLDIIQLHREIAAQCLADTKEMLNEKEDKFDECFVGLQIAKHASMKSKLTVLQRHASGELAQLLKQGTQTTEEHLEHAEKLIKQLADSSSSESGGRRNQSKRQKSE